MWSVSVCVSRIRSHVHAKATHTSDSLAQVVAPLRPPPRRNGWGKYWPGESSEDEEGPVRAARRRHQKYPVRHRARPPPPPCVQLAASVARAQ